MTMPIPVLNVFYLYCYAWRLIREGRTIDVGTDETPNSASFFARVLLNGTRRLLRRGLEQGYSEFEEDTTTIRGKINVTRTLDKLIMPVGKLHCAYEELVYDTVSNRIIKSTVFDLMKSSQVHNDLRDELRDLVGRLHLVSLQAISRSDFLL
jgi:5-methylcytosine-specific restriction enzyme subunit McrC